MSFAVRLRELAAALRTNDPVLSSQAIRSRLAALEAELKALPESGNVVWVPWEEPILAEELRHIGYSLAGVARRMVERGPGSEDALEWLERAYTMQCAGQILEDLADALEARQKR